MRVQSAVVRLVLRTNKVLADGRHPIMLRVSFGHRKERATGYACDTAHWDARLQRVREGYPNAAAINSVITDFKNRVVARKLHYEMEGKPYTPEMLLDDAPTAPAKPAVPYRVVMGRMLDERQTATATQAHYRYAYRLLAGYLHDDDFPVADLTEERVFAFIHAMKERVSEGTLRTACAKVAAVCRYAMATGIIGDEEYCFRRKGYGRVLRKANKTAYIDKSCLLQIEAYYLDLVTEGDEGQWRFKPGAEQRLMKRTSREFAVCFWLAMLKLNGSAPIDVALLRGENVTTRSIADADGHRHRYYCFDFKRSKTGTPVMPRVRCDRLARAVFEPFVTTCHQRDGFLFPILQDNDLTLMRDRSHDSVRYAVQYVARVSLRWMRLVCSEINERVMADNEATGRDMPTIEVERLSCYNVRHSFAMAYLSSPGANVNALASLLSRSPNSISAYISQLCRDTELVASVDAMGI